MKSNKFTVNITKKLYFTVFLIIFILSSVALPLIENKIINIMGLSVTDNDEKIFTDIYPTIIEDSDNRFFGHCSDIVIDSSGRIVFTTFMTISEESDTWQIIGRIEKNGTVLINPIIQSNPEMHKFCLYQSPIENTSTYFFWDQETSADNSEKNIIWGKLNDKDLSYSLVLLNSLFTGGIREIKAYTVNQNNTILVVVEDNYLFDEYISTLHVFQLNSGKYDTFKVSDSNMTLRTQTTVLKNGTIFFWKQIYLNDKWIITPYKVLLENNSYSELISLSNETSSFEGCPVIKTVNNEIFALDIIGISEDYFAASIKRFNNYTFETVFTSTFNSTMTLPKMTFDSYGNPLLFYNYRIVNDNLEGYYLYMINTSIYPINYYPIDNFHSRSEDYHNNADYYDFNVKRHNNGLISVIYVGYTLPKEERKLYNIDENNIKGLFIATTDSLYDLIIPYQSQTKIIEIIDIIIGVLIVIGLITAIVGTIVIFRRKKLFK